MRPKIVLQRFWVLFLAGFGAGVMASLAQAARFNGELYGVPISLNPPTAYTKAFRGTGYAGELQMILPDRVSKAGVSFLTQQKGQLASVVYEYYLIGKPQTRVEKDPVEPAVTFESSHTGLYGLGGITAFQVSKTGSDTVVTTNSGLGLVYGVGFDYPLFSSVYLTSRILGVLSSGGPSGMVATQIGFGLPFSF